MVDTRSKSTRNETVQQGGWAQKTKARTEIPRAPPRGRFLGAPETSNDLNERIPSLKEYMLQLPKNVDTLLQQNERLLLQILGNERSAQLNREKEEESGEEEVEKSEDAQYS